MFTLFIQRLTAIHDLKNLVSAKIDKGGYDVLSPNLKTRITPLAYLETNEILDEIYASAS